MMFIVGTASPAVFAQTPPDASPPPASESPQPAEPRKEAPDPAASKPVNRKEVPKLAIRWDCKDCAINEKVAPLIEKSYADEAAKNGYAVSDVETAQVVITDFRQRPPGARVMFGFMAGRDRLAVRIVYRDKEKTAEDYSANAWLGMNSLCESVGKQSYEQLLSIVQAGPTAQTR